MMSNIKTKILQGSPWYSNERQNMYWDKWEIKIAFSKDCGILSILFLVPALLLCQSAIFINILLFIHDLY